MKLSIVRREWIEYGETKVSSNVTKLYFRIIENHMDNTTRIKTSDRLEVKRTNTSLRDSSRYPCKESTMNQEQ